MYLFICNLSIVDIFLTSVSVPKLLHMLLSGNHIVSSAQCYTQLYFFLAVAVVEDILLFVMAYDRYVAICDPLHYPQILSQRNCTLITIGIWVVAFFNSFMFVNLVLHMSSCHSNLIQQFYCDVKSLTKTTCTSSQLLFVIIAVETSILTGFPMLCTCISYVIIFSVVHKMKSRKSRSKAFSTCYSHITVVTVFYGTCIAEYLIPADSDILDSVFGTIYSTITPMINPIIYSLQNSNVQSALLRLGRR
ncbi:hypothetical protein GDO81_019860, partial [Engystomops pustulosus]